MILTCVIGSLLVVVLCDDIIARLELRQLKLAAAETVASALGNSVLVEGIELPKPDDIRFDITKRTASATTDGGAVEYTVTLLSLGELHLEERGNVYVGSAPSICTDNTKNYCSAAWKAYRSRVSRKSIENVT